MDRVRKDSEPTVINLNYKLSTDERATRFNGGRYYHAVIKRNGEVIERLPTRYNDQEALQKFIDDHWLGTLRYDGIDESRPFSELIVWRSRARGQDVYIHARWQHHDPYIDNPAISTDDLLWLRSR